MRLRLPLSVTAALLICATSLGQENNPVNVIRPVFKKTPPLRDLIARPPTFTPAVIRDENGMIGINKKTAIIHPFIENDNPNALPDPLVNQGGSNVIEATGTIGQNFTAQPYTFVSPADPVSVTGPSHIVQMINMTTGTFIRIYDKTGTPVVPSFNLSSITDVQGAGDPIVLYDQLAGRWVFNEFGYSGGVTTYINTLIFAISATDDPLGEWYVYYFADNFFVDYQKVAIWHNAYYATSNDFNTAGSSYLGSSIYAFERNKMLAGDPAAIAIRSRQSHSTGRYFSMAPVTQEGPNSSSLSGSFCFYQNNSWTADPTDADSLYIFNFTPDFAVPANSVISSSTQMEIAALDDDLCGATRERCINQQGGVALEALTGRLMNKVIYRKFPAHESIVLNATVDANGSGLAGIRWWELRRSGGNWSIFQEGTYSPDGLHRFMGTIDMDARGNIALAYNTSSTTSFPSLRFTGRNPCDAAGTMTMAEQTIVTGTAANSSARYGDYNALSIDPSDNLTFWFTGMYNPATTWSTRIASFTIDNCNVQPKIRFDKSIITAKEADGSVVSGCQTYVEYTANVVIDAAPSADAIATFTLGGTAVNNRDYTISPASVTLNGANLTRLVTIRVFNDAALEGNESLVLGYTLNNSGGNAAIDDYNQTCTVNIVDNEYSPYLSSTVTKSWGEQTTNTITSGPFNGLGVSDKRLQNLYYAADMQAHGLSAGNITHLAWYFNSLTVETFNNFTIQVGFTNATTLSGGFVSPTFTTVHSSNFTTPGATGWYTIAFSTPVAWNGTDNLVIQTCWDDAAAVGNDVQLLGMNATYTASALFRHNAAGSVCATPSNTTSAARPNLQLTVEMSGVPVASTIVSKVASLGPNDEVPFYDAAGRVLAIVRNNSAWDYGCTTVEIDRQGNGATAFWNNNSANFLTTKTFRVTPTNPNPAGNYDITLYYTAAEKAGFEAATGNNWATIQMVKTSGPVSATTPATPSANTVTINSSLTHSAFGNDYAVKGTFSNGFSGFALGLPGSVLPVTWLSFTASKKDKTVRLDWKTASEFNNSHFVIETAKGNNNFYSIGNMPSGGNSQSIQSYQFTDLFPAKGVNYFRIRQVDLDGRSSLSQIVPIIFDEELGIFSIYPNPADSRLTITFSAPAANVQLRLLSLDGKIIKNTNLNAVIRNYEMDLAGITAGSYILEIQTAGRTHSVVFVKQ